LKVDNEKIQVYIQQNEDASALLSFLDFNIIKINGIDYLQYKKEISSFNSLKRLLLCILESSFEPNNLIEKNQLMDHLSSDLNVSFKHITSTEIITKIKQASKHKKLEDDKNIINNHK